MANDTDFASVDTIHSGRSSSHVYHPGHGGETALPVGEVLATNASERRLRLSSIIEGEIIPRLMMLHHQSSSIHPDLDPPSNDDIVQFGQLVMGADRDSAAFYFNAMRDKGHSLDSLFVNFLAPTARHLGELWEQDLCDFVDVTIGVGRLQELLSIYGAQEDPNVSKVQRRALLVTIPGEKHLFGIDMVAKLMRGAGWSVTIAAGHSPRELSSFVAREWFGVLGLTLSGPDGLEVVSRTIETIRRASCNPTIATMVGGPAFHGHPQRIVQVGADAAADDAVAAVLLAKKLLVAQYLPSQQN